jgi:N-acyl homoserine lactone hydrolase
MGAHERLSNFTATLVFAGGGAVARYLSLLVLVIVMVAGVRMSSAAEAESTLRLYVFDCGVIRLETVELFSIADEETDVRDLSVPCYVVEHEKGRLLWDGGLPSGYADVEGWQGQEGMQFRLDETFAKQIAGIGLSMSSFDYVVFSHMHFDHVGVANEVKGANLIIQEPEYEAAFNGGPGADAFDTTLFDSLADAERTIISGDHDVFGDGRVKIISAPGHTPGHQVLWIDLQNTGPIVLSGDLYHFAFSRRERRVPGFNFDRDMTLHSMDRVEGLIKETGATLWIEHELARFEQLQKAPAYYD